MIEDRFVPPSGAFTRSVPVRFSHCDPAGIVYHSPIAQPAKGARYWFVAESEAEAVITIVYGIAPASSNTLMKRAMLDCFCPTAT